MPHIPRTETAREERDGWPGSSRSLAPLPEHEPLSPFADRSSGGNSADDCRQTVGGDRPREREGGIAELLSHMLRMPSVFSLQSSSSQGRLSSRSNDISLHKPLSADSEAVQLARESCSQREMEKGCVGEEKTERETERETHARALWQRPQHAAEENRKKNNHANDNNTHKNNNNHSSDNIIKTFDDSRIVTFQEKEKEKARQQQRERVRDSDRRRNSEREGKTTPLSTCLSVSGTLARVLFPDLERHRDHVNSFFQFTSSSLRQEYVLYSRQKHSSFFFFLLVNLFLTAVAILSVIFSLDCRVIFGSNSNVCAYKHISLSHIATAIGLFAPLAGWALFVLQTAEIYLARESEREKERARERGREKQRREEFEKSMWHRRKPVERLKKDKERDSNTNTDAERDLEVGQRKTANFNGLEKQETNSKTSPFLCARCVKWCTELWGHGVRRKETAEYIVSLLQPWRVSLQCIFLFSTLASFSLRVVQRTLAGQCRGDMQNASLGQTWLCNPNADTYSLPFETTAILLVAPAVLAQLMRDARVEFLIFCVCFDMCSLLYAGVVVRSSRVLISVGCAVFFALFSSIDISLQSMFMFLAHRRVQMTLDENERMAEQTYVNEMRHMIANVAHDLKTPLSSFMTGIDIIAQVSHDMLALYEAQQQFFANLCRQNDPSLIQFPSALQSAAVSRCHTMQESIKTITYCVKNIRSTHSFMLMTINRCIDYTKASKGLRLVPKPETIDLREAVELPLSCMRNFQSKVSIVLEPWRETLGDAVEGEGEESEKEGESESSVICSHIMTDKQWLQENLLCLLSNAVKYSQEGPVTVKIFLFTRIEVAEKSVAPSSVPLSNTQSGLCGENNNLLVQNSSVFDLSDLPVRNDSGSSLAEKGRKYKVGTSAREGDAERETVIEEFIDRNMNEGLSPLSPGRKKPCLNQTFSRNMRPTGSRAPLSGDMRVYPIEDEKYESGKSSRPLPFIGSPFPHECPPNKISQQASQSTHASSAVFTPQMSLFSSHASQRTHEDVSRKYLVKTEFLVFEVEDHGIGVDKDHMKTLFNPFKQAQRLAGGTGLGLYSLAKRVEALKGECGVRKRRDGQEGSLFWFSIPYRPDKVVAQQAAQVACAQPEKTISTRSSQAKQCLRRARYYLRMLIEKMWNHSCCKSRWHSWSELLLWTTIPTH